MRSFGIIFMACGLWAFILGMVTNGFLGDFFPRFFHINLPTVIPVSYTHLTLPTSDLV